MYVAETRTADNHRHSVFGKIKKDIFNSKDLEEASAKFLTYEENLKEAYVDFVRALCRNK